MEPLNNQLDPLLLQNDEQTEVLRDVSRTAQDQLVLQDDISNGIKDLNKTAEHLLLQGDEQKNQTFEIEANDANSLALWNLLRGPRGLKGDKGDKGDTGDNAIHNPEVAVKALRGDKEFQEAVKGKDGRDGVDGINGIDGRDGIDGKDGRDGADGRDGIDGKDGAKGERGPRGPKGEAGKDGADVDPEKIKEWEEKLEFMSRGGQTSKTVSMSELDDVDLSNATQVNGKYVIPSATAGSGDVVGPASATDGAIPLYDGITGKLIKNSVYTPASFAPALGPDDNYVTDAEKVVIGNTSGTNSGNETTSTLGATINGAGAATPNDTDLFTLVESSVVKKLTGTNLKAYLKTYFDTLYASIGGGGATTALDNLASVAINTTLVSDTDNTDDLGTTLKKWANLFVTTIGATATRVTKGWFTDIESTNIPTVGGTPLLSSMTAPQFTTLELGHASDTTLSRSAAGQLAVEGVDVLTTSNTKTVTGKTLTDAVNNVSTPTTTSVGYLGIPQNSQSAAYTTVMADSGKHIYHPSSDANARTFTIDSNANVAYPIGTTLTFVNETTQVVTIAITSDTLVLAGTGTTGSRSLAQYGMATAVKVTSTRWVINGVGLT